MKIETVDALRELLAALRDLGVSEYQTPDLTVRFAAAKAPPAPAELADEKDESWSDIEKRLRRRDLEEQFAHVPGGVPPEYLEGASS